MSNKKSRISFGSTMQSELYEQLQKLSSDTDIPMTKLLDRAVQMLLINMRMSEDKSPNNE